MMAGVLGGSMAPILATLATVIISALVASKLVQLLDESSRRVGAGKITPTPPKPIGPVPLDAVPFGIGFLGQTIAAILQDAASVWSYFIDLGAFAVATVLIVVYKPNSVARIVGLLIFGIHAAQIVVSSDNSPMHWLVEDVRSWLRYAPS